jgi:hypothetical protein
VRGFIAEAGATATFIEEDAPLDGVLIRLCDQIATGAWTLDFALQAG